MIVHEAKLILTAREIAKTYHNEFITPEHVILASLSGSDTRKVLKKLSIDADTLEKDLKTYIMDSSLEPLYWSKDIEITYSESLQYAIQAIDEICENDKTYIGSMESAVRLVLYAMATSGSQVLENALIAQNVEIESLLKSDKKQESNQVKNKRIDLRNRYLRFPEITDLDNDLVVTLLKHEDKIEDSIYKLGTRLSNPFKVDIFIKEKGKFLDTMVDVILVHAYYKMNAFIPVECDLADIIMSQGAKMAASDVINSVMGTCESLSVQNGNKPVVLFLYNSIGSTGSEQAIVKYMLGYKNRKHTSIILTDAESLYTQCKDVMDSTGLVVSRDDVGILSEMDILNLYREEVQIASDLELTDDAFDTVVKVAKEMSSADTYFNKVKVILPEYVIYTKNNEKYNDRQIVNTEIIKEMFKSLGKDYEKALSRVEHEKEVSKHRSLNEKLKENIFGQDKAIDTVTKYIEISQAGLSDEHKPMGSFLFVGPTGVGKTELARQLADKLGYKLLKYDMSEYSESFTVSRLLGSPAGYVGYENGHTMVDDITANPKSVVLLDEIEKAHPKIYDILLQITDDASLTDGRNGKADFSNAVIIMTSNAGAQDSTKRGIGFGNDKFNSDGMKNAVNMLFKPEFRGRLSSIVEFNSLGNDIYKNIVEKELLKIQDKMTKNGGKHFIWNNDTVEFIVNHVDTKDSGARQISKYILDNVTAEIGHLVVNNPDKTEYVLTCNNDGLNIE